jgi:hypothetical protein
MPAVHVRITDAATNQPLPVRLRVTDAAGRDCVPFGRPAVFRTGPGEDVGGQVRIDGQNWYYVDGGAEMVIPPGRVRIEAWHGFEYRPLVHETEVKAGQLAVRVQMERWTDERERGWYSGDTSVFEIDPFSALLEGAAEDVNVVNILARELNVGGAVRIPNLTAFSGATAAQARPWHLVAVGTQNSHPELGSLALLGCHRPVFPLRCGVPDGQIDWSLIDWCEQAHRKKDGVAIWADVERALEFGEPLAAAILGKIDAIEIRPEHPSDTLMLNDFFLMVGIGLTLVGGSGKSSNAELAGRMRTYARLLPEQSFDYPAWLAAVRAGRTYVTEGPLLNLTVSGADERGVVRVPEGGTVNISAEARSVLPFEYLELVSEGQVVEKVEPVGDPLHASITTEHAVGWDHLITVHCRQGMRIVAQTSPIRVEVGRPGHRRLAHSAGARQVRAALDHTRRWATEHPGPHDERFRQQLLANLDAAERRLTAT